MENSNLEEIDKSAMKMNKQFTNLQELIKLHIKKFFIAV